MLLFQKPSIKSSISLLLIISIILTIAGSVLLFPKQTNAMGCAVNIVSDTDATWEFSWEALQNYFRWENVATLVADLLISIWEKKWTILEWLMGVFLNLLLHQILAQLTNDIVNWIQNGTEPRFLTMGLGDWLGMAVDNALGTFIDQYLGIGWLCEPFDIDIKIAMLDQITFKEDAKCSISDMVENIEDFYNDFSKGGWKGWVKMTEGGNNVYVAYLLAADERYKIIGNEEEEQKAEIARGDGFFSPKDCVWYDANDTPIDLQVDPDTGRKYTGGYKDVWGTPSLPSQCQPSKADTAAPFDTVGGVAGPCYKRCISHTPGKQVSDAVSKTINRFWDTINAQITAATDNAGPYSVYVQAILTALVNRTFKEGYGLLFAQDEAIPKQGDLGYNSTTPPICDPGTNEENQVMVGLLKTALSSLEESLTCTGGSCLLDQQTKYLAMLNAIRTKYLEIDLILDQILDPDNECDDQLSWANSAKSSITAKITSIETEIASITTAIATTQSWITQITAINTALDNYLAKYNVWEAAYEAAGGKCDSTDPNDPPTKAQADLDAAEAAAISLLKSLLTEINGTSTGTTFTELKTEVANAYSTVMNMALALFNEIGTSFGESGTLNAILIEAEQLKTTASGYLNACLTP